MSVCRFFLLVLSLYTIQDVAGVPRVDPLVDTKVGLIRGLRASDGDYSMFLGIPYAKVNEDNPFGPSVPYPEFEEAFEAYDDSAICPQIEEFTNTITGTLDCLHLNIYVPTAANSRNRLPVMVWIHGGGFQVGFSGRYIYGPKYLVNHGIVLVTMNYRLGPYGFMCLDTPEVPGNQGMKDQLSALRWIKDNIEAFGGDSNKITIFGESAGAASVDLHLHSAQEKLFHRAIIQSGVSVSPWVVSGTDNSAPLKLAEHLGYVTSDVNAALTFLAKTDTKLIIAASNEVDVNFKICVEKDFDNVEKFIAEYPVIANVPKVKRIPILIGFNNDEWLSRYANQDAEFFKKFDVVSQVLQESFDFDSQDISQEMIEIVQHFYFGDKAVSEDTKQQVIDLTSDFAFYHPTQRMIRKYFKNNAASIFSYLFSYTGDRNFAKDLGNITTGGAAHADEIGYLFDISYMDKKNDNEDQIIVDRMTTLWTNFVKHGDPTPETTDLLPVKWTPVSKDTWTYLNIDSELSIQTRPFHDRLAFLDLFYKMNENYQKGFNKGNEQ